MRMLYLTTTSLEEAITTNINTRNNINQAPPSHNHNNNNNIQSVSQLRVANPREGLNRLYEAVLPGSRTLTSCFSAAPAVHTIADEAPSRRRRMTQGKSRKNWGPALAAIDEDASVREARKQNAQTAAGFRSEKKPLIKSKLVGKIRSDSYESDHRKSNHAFALPAYSPTPFVF